MTTDSAPPPAWAHPALEQYADTVREALADRDQHHLLVAVPPVSRYMPPADPAVRAGHVLTFHFREARVDDGVPGPQDCYRVATDQYGRAITSEVLWCR